MRGTLAGLIVVFVIAIAVWQFGKSADKDFPSAAGHRGRIGEASSMTSKRASPAVKEMARTVHKDSANMREESQAGESASHTSDGPSIAVTNQLSRKKPAFANSAEQLLAMAIPSSPGESVPPLPDITDDGIAADVKKAMKNIIKAEEGDSKSALEKKIIVAEAKEQFRDLRQSEGYTFAEYLKALRDQANLDADFLAEAHKLSEDLYNDQSVSDADYMKYRDQINEKLRERGLPEIQPEGTKEKSNEDTAN